MNDNLDALALLGLWMFTAIQLGKGKAWPLKWTIYFSLLLPFALAVVPVWGSDSVKLYAEYVAKIFLYGTSTWAVGSLTQKAKEDKPVG
jgi:hypothetical protein